MILSALLPQTVAAMNRAADATSGRGAEEVPAQLATCTAALCAAANPTPTPMDKKLMMANTRLSRPLNRSWFWALSMLVALALPATAADFVGSLTCRNCHRSKHTTVTNSIHSKMIRVNAHLPGVIHGDLRKPNAPTTNDVHWVMGGWYKEESYIRTNYTGSNWTYTVTQYQYDPIAETYVNNQSLRDWLVKCAGCHTTGYNPTTRTFNELNIGCESCHGPGSDHVANDGAKEFIKIDRSNEGCGFCHIRAESAATAEFPAKAFNFPIGYVLGQTNTLKFIPEPLTATASFFPDGTAKRHREQYLDMHYPGVHVTQHYLKGVTCISCHDPHKAGTVSTYETALPTNKFGVKMFDNVNGTTNYVAWDGGQIWHPTAKTNIAPAALCKACHTTVSDHHVHQFNAAAAAANVTCVDCHMPDVINVDPKTLRGALRPHTFATLIPANSMKYGPTAQPNSCTYHCHQNTGANTTDRARWADSIITHKLAPIVGTGHANSFRVVGTPEYQYVLEATTDFHTWTPVLTNSAVPLPNYAPRWGFEFADPSGPGLRFYRSRQLNPVP